MKRLGFLFAIVLAGSMMAGCTGGGLNEGAPTTEIPKSSMSDSHKAFMEANAAKMQMKGKPKNMPKPAAPQ